jgi:hypothetical protein
MQMSTPRRWWSDRPAWTAWAAMAAMVGWIRSTRTWDRHAAALSFITDQVELVAGAVDQHHPGAAVGRVTLGGLVEHRPNDLLAWLGD